MVDRLFRLRQFAFAAAVRGLQAQAPVAIGALPIAHRPIRALPLMIVHGHDLVARLELENFLRRYFPHVAPVAMIAQTQAAHTLPEKFERLAREVKGAVALLTPDDAALTFQSGISSERARQNVIIELGWFWGKLGRQRCLLLMRGSIELPSDLSGVEVHRFEKSPTECSEALREFITALEV
jgi:predicted nucleotide-binding protein